MNSEKKVRDSQETYRITEKISTSILGPIEEESYDEGTDQ